ncbi:substrate-binding periplasmic protein [Chitinibacter sp. S2-10]|uniref:substrate-binding periplasmic protein n=1 Tax=Chitinibacter sp. S2-10 TaxID=3373597 RepID=UPI0039775E20
MQIFSSCWLAVAALVLVCPTAQAEHVKVIFGQSRPPFVNEKTQSGISIELMDEAFKRMDIHVNRQFGANRRMDVELKMGRVDIAVEVHPSDKNIHYSQPFIIYRNFAISKDGKDYPSWQSMAGRSVCAWQTAKESLGEAFAKAVPQFAEYQEYPDQTLQVFAWLSGGCDISLIDDTLFYESVRQLLKKSPELHAPDKAMLRLTPLPSAHQLWWHVGFRSKTLRDQFDLVLQQMRADGSYQRIRERYNQP